MVDATADRSALLLAARMAVSSDDKTVASMDDKTVDWTETLLDSQMVEHLDGEMAAMKAGMWALQMAVETGDPKVERTDGMTVLRLAA